MRRLFIAACAAVAIYGAGLAAQQPAGTAQQQAGTAQQPAGTAQQQAAAPPPQIRTAKQMPFPQKPDWAKLEVETLHVKGKVHMIAGAGGNIAAQVGDEGVLLVDTGYEQMSGKVIAAMRKLSNGTLRRIINTTLMDSHTGANAVMIKQGRLNQAGPGLGQRPNEADLISHSGLLALMTEIGREKIVPERWPPSVFSSKQKDLYSNEEPVVILHVPNAVTSGDSIVWFRGSDVVVTGEIFNQASFPYIDMAHGGTINGVIEGLNMLLDIMVPKHNQEGGTMAIPGYGRIGDEHDVLEYRDMVTIIRDRVQAAIDKKMTLAQVKAMKPSATFEYELRFNRDPAWTAEMFVETIYRNLSTKK